jgi:hypothetical protein
MTKLWLDDVRKPPDSSWDWVKTAPDAINFLTYHHVDGVSLDFDLGEGGVTKGANGETVILPSHSPGAGYGIDVARFILANFSPGEIAISIHSQNPVGAKQMRDLFNDAGFSVP